MKRIVVIFIKNPLYGFSAVRCIRIVQYDFMD